MDSEEARKKLLQIALAFQASPFILLTLTAGLFPDAATTLETIPLISWLTLAIAVAAIPASLLLRGMSLRRTALAEDGQPAAGVGGRISTAVILGIALAEQGSLWGFVSLYLDGAFIVSAVAMVIGAVAISLHLPTRARWDSWKAVVEGSEIPGIIH